MLCCGGFGVELMICLIRGAAGIISKIWGKFLDISHHNCARFLERFLCNQPRLLKQNKAWSIATTLLSCVWRLCVKKVNRLWIRFCSVGTVWVGLLHKSPQLWHTLTQTSGRTHRQRSAQSKSKESMVYSRRQCGGCSQKTLLRDSSCTATICKPLLRRARKVDAVEEGCFRGDHEVDGQTSGELCEWKWFGSPCARQPGLCHRHAEECTMDAGEPPVSPSSRFVHISGCRFGPAMGKELQAVEVVPAGRADRVHRSREPVRSDDFDSQGPRSGENLENGSVVWCMCCLLWSPGHNLRKSDSPQNGGENSPLRIPTWNMGGRGLSKWEKVGRRLGTWWKLPPWCLGLSRWDKVRRGLWTLWRALPWCQDLSRWDKGGRGIWTLWRAPPWCQALPRWDKVGRGLGTWWRVPWCRGPSRWDKARRGLGTWWRVPWWCHGLSRWG